MPQQCTNNIQRTPTSNDLGRQGRGRGITPCAAGDAGAAAFLGKTGVPV